MSARGVIARNIFSNWANLAVSIMIGFFMMPFLIHRLGDTLYGVWVLVVSLVGYGSLLDLGVRTSIVKYVSQHHATENRERLRCLFTTVLATYSAIGALILAGAASVALFLPHLFRIPPELAAEAKLVFFIVGVDLAVKFPAGVFEGFLTGLQRYEVANGIAIGSLLLRTGLTVALVMNGGKLLALAAITLAADLLMTGLMAFACLRLLPWLSLSRRYLDRAVLRQVYSYGFWSLLVLISLRILYDSDAVLIGIFLPAAAITQFAVAGSLVRYLRQLAYGFGNVFTPAASELEARGESEQLGRLVVDGTRYALAVNVPAAVFLALVGHEFLSLWMGSRYAGDSATVLVVLVLAQVATMGQFPAEGVLFGLNRHRHLAFVLLGQASLKVALCVILMPSMGILGVAIGTAVPELIRSLLLIPALVTRFVSVPRSRYFRAAFLPPFACVLPAGGLLFALKSVAPPTSWGVLIAEVTTALFLYSAFAVRWCLDRPQRIAVLRKLDRVLRRPKS